MTAKAVSNNETKTVQLAMICDKSFVIPTIVAINSIKKSRNPGSRYALTAIVNQLSAEDKQDLLGSADDAFHVRLIDATIDSLKELHRPKANSFLVASESALLKFSLPQLLPEHNRVLYLDGDIIVREDLSELFSTNLDGVVAAVVSDSGQIYFQHQTVKSVTKYFNSGVMLLDLEKMRELNAYSALVEAKKNHCDGSLMDQNAFNIAFEGKVIHLPIRYNCLCSNLVRAQKYFSIESVNRLYGTDYTSLAELLSDAAILHFSSKDKPWKFADVPLADEWFSHYSESMFSSKKISPKDDAPSVSVIVPVYNAERYLADCLDSVCRQTEENIEIICINDGSTDRSGSILDAYSRRDKRITVSHQSNQGPSVARNRGLSSARGRYLYFLDSDDLLDRNALSILVKVSEANNLDVLYFDGDALFESPELKTRFSYYENYYKRRGEYKSVLSGKSLLVHMAKRGDYKVSPCLQFIKAEFCRDAGVTFRDGMVHEDNLFSMQIILNARRAAHLKQILFHRRVRNNSIMTMPKDNRHLMGYLTTATEMSSLLAKWGTEQDLADVIIGQIVNMHQRALKIYVSLATEKLRGSGERLGPTELYLKAFSEIHRKSIGDIHKAHLQLSHELLRPKEGELQRKHE